MAQAPHHAPDEPKARALVLVGEGHSPEYVGGLVGVSGRTVRRWVNRCREVSLNQETPEMMDDWVRIIRRSQGMQHAVLDVAEHYATIATNDHPGPLAEIARQVASKELMKHALLYNIYAGTGTDKLQKDSAPPQPQAVTINFVFKDAPIIEGELVE
ncbi:hypothetical protein LCGC14_2054240 [marine sediment metagenome]|uniref:Uncharacterized protein n=1 Tax=marine sediment metagenome TaxID=412755 RepID=A0A0F9H1I0_9ZZZZ